MILLATFAAVTATVQVTAQILERTTISGPQAVEIVGLAMPDSRRGGSVRLNCAKLSVSGPPNTAYSLSQALTFPQQGLRSRPIETKSGFLSSSGQTDVPTDGSVDIAPGTLGGTYGAHQLVTVSFN